MYLKILKISEKLEQEAQSFFDIKYIQSLKTKESLIARYIISQQIGNNYLPEVTQEGIPKYQNAKYWSISHKSDIIFIGIDDKQIGLDIEYLKPRDPSLLNTFTQVEYEMLGGKKWENFYVLWTAHEALIKYHRETHYQEGIYELQSCTHEKEIISDIVFDIKLQLLFKGDTYTVYTSIGSNYIYSLCTKIGEN